MAAMLIARFDGDVHALTEAYERAHAVIMGRGGAVPSGELHHYCATDDGSLFIIGLWESEGHIRRRWSSDEFAELLTSAGLPPPSDAHITVLRVHATEPPLPPGLLHPSPAGP